jgi:hypothetical protein
MRKYGEPNIMNGVAKVYYEIPDDLHQRAKVAASVRGQSLKDLIIDALTALVKETEKEHYRRLGQRISDQDAANTGEKS